MRFFYIITLFCLLGCSQFESAKPIASSGKQEHPLTTLDNLVYFDAATAAYQHPLVCIADGDFPSGRELTFRDSESGKTLHAVFPDKTSAPKQLDGKFVLHDHFQDIQNKDHYKLKKPEKDYQYFVVSSWEHKK